MFLLCGVADSDELVWHEFITWKTGEKWTTKYSEGLPVPTAQVVLWTSQSFPENGDGDNEEQGKVAPSNWQDNKYWLFMTKILVCPLQKVSLWKKIYVVYSFFFVRKVVAHINTFVFYCIVLPATVVVPEVVVPKWGAVYIPSIITLLNAVGTPRSSFSLLFPFF